MILRSSSFLGVSLSDRSIACAEVAVNGNRRVVRRLVSFALTPEMSLDKPADVGHAFSAFLRKNGFGASRAIIGVPAKWLIALEKELPPSGEEQARAMLRLQAERLGVSESGEMVFDYAGEADSQKANKVLLVGVLRQRLDQIEKLCDAAGLSIQAVTASALTLARGTMSAEEDMHMLVLGRQGAEMVWRHEGLPRMLRHVGVMAVNGHGPVTLGPLGSELSRTLALTRANGSPVARELLLWDGVGLSPEQLNDLSERSGVKLRPSNTVSMLKLDPSAGALASGDQSQAETFAPALSLAVAGAERDLLTVDFRRSRLMPRRARKLSRQTTWGIIIGAIALLGVAALYASVEMRQREFDQLKREVDGMAKDVQTAQTLVDRATYAQSFFDKRPSFLECLREINSSLRDDEPIWISNVTIHDEDRRTGKEKSISLRKGTIDGRARDQQTVNNVIDRLRKNPKFSDVKLPKLTSDKENKSREVSFTATFNFIAPE